MVNLKRVYETRTKPIVERLYFCHLGTLYTFQQRKEKRMDYLPI